MRIVLLLGVLSASLLSPILSYAANATYFRVWQGFKKPSLSSQEFLTQLPPFMKSTAVLYNDKLNDYVVVIPPAKKPIYIPDELALIAFYNEDDYQKIRATPEGTAYGESHWTIFDKEKSKSAPLKLLTEKLETNTAYDLSPAPLNWANGFTAVFIGTRKTEISTTDFLEHLAKHIRAVREVLTPQGLKGYVVVANENYEIAYLNWPSEAAMKKAFASEPGKLVAGDASSFLSPLMWEGTKKPTQPIGTGAYSSKRSDFLKLGSVKK